jgi:hypothetical protein
MFIFIVPLRSPDTCSNWSTVSALCNNTLSNLLKQDSAKHRIILVCNQPPVNAIEDERITVVRESFPVPKLRSERFGDIYRKVKRGMVEVKRRELVTPDSSAFVMRVDADDLVSNRLVSFTEKHPGCDGWYFATGYIHEIGSKHLFLRPRFTTISGTSHIFKCNYADFPDSMNANPGEWLEPVWQHLNVNKLLQPRGRKLSYLPFPGAVYQINSQNGSSTQLVDPRFSSIKSKIWKILCKQQITPQLVDEFNFLDRLIIDKPIEKSLVFA